MSAPVNDPAAATAPSSTSASAVVFTTTGPAPAVEPAFAAADRDCRDFPDRASAQAALDADPSDPFRLDSDRDGVACETVTYRGAAPAALSGGGAGTARGVAAALAGADLDCRDFPDRASAQAVLDANPSDPFGLDSDRDGVACERGTGAGARISGQSGSDLALTGADGVTMLGGTGGALLGAGLGAVVLVRRLDPSGVRAAGRHRSSQS